MAVKVAVIMGSDSDIDIAKDVVAVLSEYGVEYDVRVLSAHRTPTEVAEYVKDGDFEVFVAIAGMAAHLAGSIAAYTVKPVIAVPVRSGGLGGADALLSSVMMPPGVPVATVAVNGGRNAGLLAVQIAAVGGALDLTGKLWVNKEKMRDRVLKVDAKVRDLLKNS